MEGLTRLFQFCLADLEKGVEELAPALQRILAVDCADPNAMFNRNASSDELRYIGHLPAFLNSLEYTPPHADPSSATTNGPAPPPCSRTSGKPQLTTYDALPADRSRKS